MYTYSFVEGARGFPTVGRFKNTVKRYVFSVRLFFMIYVCSSAVVKAAAEYDFVGRLFRARLACSK